MSNSDSLKTEEEIKAKQFLLHMSHPSW